MKKRSLLVIFAMVLSVMLVFTACGGQGQQNNDDNNDVTGTDDNNTTLSGTVSTDGSTSMEDVIGSLGEAFMEANDGVEVTYNPTGSGSGIMLKSLFSFS